MPLLSLKPAAMEVPMQLRCQSTRDATSDLHIRLAPNTSVSTTGCNRIEDAKFVTDVKKNFSPSAALTLARKIPWQQSGRLQKVRTYKPLYNLINRNPK